MPGSHPKPGQGDRKGECPDQPGHCDHTRVVVILDEREGERFREVGPRLVERCQEMLGAQILCYVSENIFCEEMEKTYSGLLRFSKDDVLCQESIQYVKKSRYAARTGRSSGRRG